MHQAEENSGLSNAYFYYDEACEVLKDFYMKKYVCLLPILASFYKNSDEIFFMDGGVKEGNEMRQITLDELSPHLPGIALYVALHCIKNVGRMKKSPPFDISKCKSIIEELSADNISKQELMRVGCFHLGVEEVDNLMSDIQIQHMMSALVGIMMNGCFKYRIGEMESSIVMTADSYDASSSLFELMSRKRWRKRYIACYELYKDGSVCGPMEPY